MKVKKTTGIPKSFLQKVDTVPPGKGVLVTQDGNLVIAQANEYVFTIISMFIIP